LSTPIGHVAGTAVGVEELKDEQRKRELQLEQSSERREHQPS
jgi:hypothetical protein